jgi:hypothetical protein
MSAIQALRTPKTVNTLGHTALLLEKYPLVCRGILDTAGLAVPVIALARTQQERREKILDRVIVIGSAFFLAPLHAWTLMRVMARANRVPKDLMRLSFQDLQTRRRFSQALKTLQSNSPQGVIRVNDALRKRLLRAKINMLVPDLILECLLIGGAGWMTNLFTRMSTGKNMFSGEQKATSQDNLNRLYETEKDYQRSEKLRILGSLALSVGMPVTLGLLLKHALLRRPSSSSNLVKGLRKRAHYFDYRNGTWMSMPSLGIVITAQFFGHLFAARNPRELRENFIREGMLNAIFFWGDATWRLLLAKGLYRSLKLPSPEHRMDRIQAMPLPARLKTRWLNAAGRQLWVALALNSATLAGAIVLNNRLTQKKVESDVANKLGVSSR